VVFVDFPRNPGSKTKVEDPVRNAHMAEYYAVTGFPTIVPTDAEGRPYGIEGYVEGGVDAFMERLTHWQRVRDRRDGLFFNVEHAEGEAKLAAIEEALSLLKQIRLVRYYRPTVSRWLAVAWQHDPKSQHGVLEALFEIDWLLRLTEAGKDDAKRVSDLVGELDQWEKAHPFKDPNRAALLHLYAAGGLSSIGQTREAGNYLDEGLAYKPDDPSVAAQLKALAALLAGGQAAGTGFLVSPAGHVLTNYHVIEGPGDVSARLPGRQDTLTELRDHLPQASRQRALQAAIRILKAHVSPSGKEVTHEGL
jgi:hypothetical protein